mgnify:CR=1 FL=1
MDTFLTDVQREIVDRLKADEEVGLYEVIGEERGDITADVNQALGLVSSAAGRVGLCAVVMQMVGDAESTDFPVPVLRLQPTIRVLEHPALNSSGPRALDLALRIGRVLFQYQPHGIVSPLSAATPFILPVQDPFAPVAYDVQFETYQQRATIGTKIPLPTITAAATVSIACADGAAVIRYTIDGTHPWSGNPAAILYAAPFAAASGVTVRACAFRSGYIASDVASLDIP